MMRSAAFRASFVFLVTLFMSFLPLSADEFVLSPYYGYRWTYGCSPTAGIMVMGYWDKRGYTGLLPGSPVWSDNEQAIRKAIASDGHVADYAEYNGLTDREPDDPIADMSQLDPSGAHAHDSMADFMNTSFSSLNLNYGSTRSTLIGPGMVDYAAWRGYSFESDRISGMTWQQFTSEIDLGRPVLLSVDSSGDGQTDHSVTAVAHRDVNGYAEYGCLNTWSTGLSWYRFRAPSSSYVYGVGAMTTLRPAGTWDTATNEPWGMWSEGLTWSAGTPDANAFVSVGPSAELYMYSTGAARSVVNRGSMYIGGSLSTELFHNSGRFYLEWGGILSVNGLAVNLGTFSQMEADVTLGGGYYQTGDDAAYTLESGTLSVAGAAEVLDGVFRVAGGSANFSGGLQVSSPFEWTGGSLSASDLVINSVFELGVPVGLEEFLDGTTTGSSTVVFGEYGALRITNGQTVGLDTGSVTIRALYAGSRTGSTSGTIDIGGDAVLDVKRIGVSAGEINQSGGQVGYGSGDTSVSVSGQGDYTLTGGELRGDVTIKDDTETPVFTLDGGTLAGEDLNVGEVYSPKGRFDLVSGSATFEDLTVYRSTYTVPKVPSDALFRQSGGVLTVTDDLHLNASYEMVDGTASVAGVMWVGEKYRATMKVLGGTLDTAGIGVGGLNFGLGYPVDHSRLDLVGGIVDAGSIAVTSPGSVVEHSGSDVTVNTLTIRQDGTYRYTGGSLAVNERLTLEGTLDFDHSSTVLSGGEGAFLNFTGGSVLGGSNASVYVGDGGWIMLPPGSDPDTFFADVSRGDRLVISGLTPLVVKADRLFEYGGSLACDVTCAGTIEAQYIDGAKQLNIDGTVNVLPGGWANLGEGTVLIDKPGSRLDGQWLEVGELVVGVTGEADFVQTSGVLYHEAVTVLGRDAGSSGTFTLSGGSFIPGPLTVGEAGYGRLNVDGGEATVFGAFCLGRQAGSDGELVMTGGEFKESRELGFVIGESGRGSIEQSGGLLWTGSPIVLGQAIGGQGTYTLSGTAEMLTYDDLLVGHDGTGMFNMLGGKLTIHDELVVGADSTFRMSGGQLEVKKMSASQGTLDFEGTGLDIKIGEYVWLSYGSIDADPGTTFHMPGSRFVNESTDATANAGLQNLTLLYELGTGSMGQLEIASEDRGAEPDGDVLNFAFGGLQVGGYGPAYVKLVDQYDNTPDWEGQEALYVDRLILNDGSTLDLNGYTLYYNTFDDQGGALLENGGRLVQVPEPAAMLLLGGALLAVLGRRRRRVA